MERYIGRIAAMELCPPVAIPPGFFDKAIRIRYGHEDNRSGWVNINCLKANYTYTDPNGTDYKWTLQDLPLFWQDRIAEMDRNPNFDEDLAVSKRREAFREIVQARAIWSGERISEEWVQAGLRCLEM